MEYSRISMGKKKLSTKLDFDLILMADKPQSRWSVRVFCGHPLLSPKGFIQTPLLLQLFPLAKNNWTHKITNWLLLSKAFQLWLIKLNIIWLFMRFLYRHHILKLFNSIIHFDNTIIWVLKINSIKLPLDK